MFVVVDVSDNRKRLFEKYRSHEIQLKRYDVSGCAPFFVAKCHRRYTDFDDLIKTISRYGVALISEGDDLEEKLSSVLFSPSVLPLKMLIRTIGEHFLRQGGKNNQTVTVVDRAAKGCETLPVLAKSVRYVRVVTSRFDRYESCASEIFSSYGISIDLSDDLATAYGSNVIISLNDNGLEDFDCGKIICYKKLSRQRNVFELTSCDLDYKKFDCKAYGIDPFTFVCALYETCGFSLPQIPIFKDIDQLNHIL